jgi:outer membrane protein assembly factor BamB
MKKHLISLLVLFLFLSTSFAGYSNQRKEQSAESGTSEILTDGGLMNSSWPMHCYDIRHTGRCPYSTADTPGIVKWYVKEEKFYMEGSPVIDNNGTIYCGANSLYAVNPNGTIKWKLKTGGIICSAPAIGTDGTIYFGTTMIGDGAFRAISPNGTIKWTYPVGNLVWGSPAITDDGTIYVYANNKVLYALNHNGTLKWSYHVDAGYIAYSSPAVGFDGTIYIGSLGPNDDQGYVEAVYPNGTMKWRYTVGTWVHGSAAVADDGTVYVATDIDLIALYPNNGSLKWTSALHDCTWTTPIIGPDGTIYVGSSQGYFNAVNPDGTIKWRFPISAGFWFGGSAALSSDGTVYFGTTSFMGGSGGFYAVDASNGEEKWNYTECGWYESSPAIGKDGTVYATACYDWTPNGHSFYQKGFLYAFGKGGLLRAEANGYYSVLYNKSVQLVGTIYGGMPPYTCHWDFGDGNTSEERKPRHTYTQLGNHTVTFTVTDSEGNHSSDTSYVIVGAEPPSLIIIKPVDGIYLKDTRILPFSKPFIIGKITIQVETTQEPFGIDRVEFYIDDILRATDTEASYQWIWDTTAFFKHTIKVVAYDTSGNSIGKSIGVSKFF